MAVNAAAGEEVAALRKELVALFNERFIDDLMETTKVTFLFIKII